MSYGITPQGFVRKPYAVIESELFARARSGECFGSDVDLSDENYIGADLKLMAWTLDQQWQLAESIYYSMDMDNAEGVALNRLVKLGLIDRQGAQRAVVDLLFHGETGSPVPIGSQVETEQGVVFEVLNYSLVDAEGLATTQARAVEPGTRGNVPAESIIRLKTPLSGIDSVINPLEALGGRGIETDYELRQRYYAAPASSGSALDGIVGAVANIEGIEDVIGFENIEIVEDDNGIPPKSIELVVLGGADASIAEMIFSRKPGGISTFGSSSREVTDSKGRSHLIYFSRPDEIGVWIKYILLVNNDWNSESEEYVQQAAVEFVNSLRTGQGVYGWRLASLLRDVIGLERVTVLLGTDEESILEEKLEFSIREKALAHLDRVIVDYE